MKSFIYILILLSAQLLAQSVQQQIMDKLFNGQVAEARSLIKDHLQKNPQHPKYYLINAQFNFYMRYFDNRQYDRDSVIQMMAENAQNAINYAEKYKPTTELKFYMGAAYGFLSRAYVMRQEYWDGYWAARECIDYLEQVLEEDPQYYDAYLALGIIEYFPTRLSGFLSFMAGLGGMSGDIDKAFDYIKRTSEKGDLFKNEATFVLASLYRIENDNQNALRYYAQLQQQFPDNNLVADQYRQIQLAQFIEQKGVAYFKDNLGRYLEQYAINNSNPLNNLGYSFLNRQRNELAEAVFLLNIELFPAEANPYDSISEFYEATGNNAQAVKYAMKGLEVLPADSTADGDRKELLRGLMETRIENLGSSI